MATYLDGDLLQKLLPYVFIYDLEYVGTTTDLEDCHIWDIGIVHLLSGSALEVSVAPAITSIPPPFSEEFIQVTPELLQHRNAVPFSVAFDRILRFSGPPNTPKVFISHNGFKSDKILLEIESRRHGIVLPLHWFFFDSLIFARRQLPKQTSYSLSTIHTELGLGDIPNQHFALADAFALRNVILKLDYQTLNGPMYPPYCTSLQAVKWLGPSCEHAMITNGVKGVEQLLHHILNDYTVHVIEGVVTPVDFFIEEYIVTRFGIKPGNAKSIANSLVSKWLLKL
jgi:DNA polymerase III epsilon subunit-like protein